MKKTNRLFCFLLIMVLTLIIAITAIASEQTLIEQSLEYLEEENYNMAIETLEKALLSIRQKAQLQLKNVQFTENEARGFGMYQLRQDANFEPGETFQIYAEPKNYTTKEIEEELYEIHFKEDIYLLDMEGNILWGQKGYLEYHVFSHRPYNEIFITNTITQDSPFPEGEYQFQLVLKDVLSQKTVEQTIDFVIE